MLLVTKINWSSPPTPGDTGEMLFKRNPKINLSITAPLFWWVENKKAELDTNDLFRYKEASDFCFDVWDNKHPVIQRMVLACGQAQTECAFADKPYRALLQIMPLATLCKGELNLTYQEIVEYVEDCIQGINQNSIAVRENNDLWETLLDIRGIRELVGGIINGQQDGLNSEGDK